METNNKSSRIHPLVATAAVAVTLVSLVGVAAITGLLPISHSTNAPVASLSAPVAADAGATAPQAKVAATPEQTEKIDKPAPKAVKKPAPASSRPAETSYAPKTAQAPRICYDCGRVESVQAIQQQAQPSGVGVIAGAVLGGVLGNQVGGGNGRKLATVAGAVGGGYAGNEIEKRTRATTTYQVRVRMEDGSIQTFSQTGPDGWRSGDRVRVVNGALTSRG